MKNKSIQSIMLGLATISIILVSNGIVSYAQNKLVGYNSRIQFINFKLQLYYCE